VTAEDAYERALKQRIIMIGTEIDDDVANVAIAQMLFLEHQDASSPIQLYVNSPGGSVTASIAIIDTIRTLKPPVETLCVQSAGGMAAVIVACGARGRRRARPGAELAFVPFVHMQGEVSASVLAEVERLKRWVAAALEEVTGQTQERLLEDLARGRSFSADEAWRYGLIDETA
jgi:ATP-dependent Clp protease protease subunit